MTHVLSIIHYPVFGGPHNRNMRLAPVLAERGVRTTILIPDESGNAEMRLRDAGVEVVTLPMQRLRATSSVVTHARFLRRLPASISSIGSLIERQNIDLVQINGLVNPHGALAARRLGVPVVWQILDTYSPHTLRLLMGPVLQRYADVVMCTGTRVAAEHPGAMARPGAFVSFFPPVDVSVFRPDPAVREAVRNELGLASSSFVVGTVGNINKQKGHDNFVRAAAELKRRVPGARFLIFGGQHDNHKEYIAGLWKLAEELGLKVGVDLMTMDPTGRVHELAQAMDVFWMTPKPRSEGIPTAMEEAMALSLPVVSFDVGSIGELVAHGQAGYLVEGQDPAEVARYTSEHLQSPSERERMGQLGRSFILEHASLEACAERHALAYSLAMQKHGSRGSSEQPVASKAGVSKRS